MTDVHDDDKPASERPREFPVEVTVNGVRVTVTLLLAPGTTVKLADVAVKTPEPTPAP